MTDSGVGNGDTMRRQMVAIHSGDGGASCGAVVVAAAAQWPTNCAHDAMEHGLCGCGCRAMIAAVPDRPLLH